MNATAGFSRRRFLAQAAATGALVLGTRLVPTSVFTQHTTSGPWEPGVYLAILPDGTVHIVAHRSEMGTGIRTALPLVGRDLFDRVVATIRERAADFEPAVSHPDITAANVIVSGEAPIIIDNELLCRSRHHRIDILNLLHNLDAVDRPRAFASYLDLAGVTPGEWHRHTDYLRHLWLARQVGSDVRRNDLAGAQARVRTFVAGDNILPIDPAGPLAEPPDGRP